MCNAPCEARHLLGVNLASMWCLCARQLSDGCLLFLYAIGWRQRGPYCALKWYLRFRYIALSNARASMVFLGGVQLASALFLAAAIWPGTLMCVFLVCVWRLRYHCVVRTDFPQLGGISA